MNLASVYQGVYFLDPHSRQRDISIKNLPDYNLSFPNKEIENISYTF
jgi:hypothetical protein